MASCLTLLDEALQIGTQELDALRAEDMDLVEQCFEKRTLLTEQALHAHRAAGASAHETAGLRERMTTLQELEKALYAEAHKLKMDIQGSLVASRKQTQRMRGYGLAVRQAQQL